MLVMQVIGKQRAFCNVIGACAPTGSAAGRTNIFDMRRFREMAVSNRLHGCVSEGVFNTKNLREPSENHHQKKGRR